MDRVPVTIDDLDREAVESARSRDPGEKLRDGLRLFDRTCRVMADGIRHEFPDADPPLVHRLLRERLRLARDLERR